jgi:hypothetical protein
MIAARTPAPIAHVMAVWALGKFVTQIRHRDVGAIECCLRFRWSKTSPASVDVRLTTVLGIGTPL